MNSYEQLNEMIRTEAMGWSFTACVLVMYMMNLLSLQGSITKFRKMFTQLHLIKSWETQFVFIIGDWGFFILMTIVAVVPLLIMMRCPSRYMKVRRYGPLISAASFCLLLKLYFIGITSGLSHVS
jgi:hypothetical protein